MTRYCLATSHYPESLSEHVNEMLDDGWELYGPPTATNDVRGRSEYVQVMVKREKTEITPVVDKYRVVERLNPDRLEADK